MTLGSKNITKRPSYQTMDGIIYPASYSPKLFREALDYKPKPNDVFIVTYPRSGTTWMQNVVLYIFRKGKELDDISLFLKYCPFIDMCGKECIDKLPRPGAFKTHLPYTRMPYSPVAKYIFVARNPKDCLTSLFHHTTNQLCFSYWDGLFDEFYELFMAEEIEYNGYFSHLLSWYPHRNDPNILYTTYEKMKRDIRQVIIQLATFLGEEYIDAIEKDNAVFHNIIHFSGFEYMQKNLSNVYDMGPKKGEILKEPKTYEGISHIREYISMLDLPMNIPKPRFIRKGVVGNWKNALSKEQNERLNQEFFERTKGTDIPKWFSMS